MSGNIFRSKLFSNFANGVGHATLDVLVALSGELKFEAWENLLDDCSGVAVLSKLGKAVDCFRSDLGLAVIHESGVDWDDVLVHLLFLQVLCNLGGVLSDGEPQSPSLLVLISKFDLRHYISNNCRWVLQ